MNASSKQSAAYAGNPDRLARVKAELTKRGGLSADSVANLVRCSLVDARAELRQLVARGEAETYETRSGSIVMYRSIK